MYSKMNPISLKVCQACLSNDRLLYSLHAMDYLLKTMDVFFINKDGGVCWECKAIMNNFIIFKEQVNKAQESLSSQPQTLKSLSRLKSHFNVINIVYNSEDPLSTITFSNEDVKQEEDNQENCIYHGGKEIFIEIDHKNWKYENVSQTNIDEDAGKLWKQTNEKTKKRQSSKKSSEINQEILTNIEKTDEHTQNCLKQLECTNSKEGKRKVRRPTQKLRPRRRAALRKREERKERDTITQSGLCKIKAETEEQDDNLKKITEYVRDEVINKYTFITHTKEEVMKIRDDKRSQPNYKKMPYKCNTCVLGFTREETFILHMANKHNKSKGEYVCDICETRFPMLVALRRHEENHYSSYQCRLCKYDTAVLHAIVTHCKLKHTDDVPGDIRCKQCAYTAPTPDDMAAHNRIEHLFCCDECGSKFASRNTLRKHKLRLHTSKVSFTCDMCNKTFMTKSRLEAHIIIHNATLAKKLAYCGTCKVQYKNLYIYRSHLINSPHHSARTYQCSHCSKSFASKSYLNKHSEFYHLKKSAFVCDVCDKLFISRWRLTRHKQVQHGLTRTRGHACDTCGKGFFSVTTLRYHKLIHSEQRRYMCEDCGDTFKQPASLYTHMRLLHKGTKTSGKPTPQ